MISLALAAALLLPCQAADIRALGSSCWADREAAIARLSARPPAEIAAGLGSSDPEIRLNTLRAIRRKDPCKSCLGRPIISHWNAYTNIYEDIQCYDCLGYGSPWLKDVHFRGTRLCPNCSGSGKQMWTEAMAADGAVGGLGLHPCRHCKGKGFR